MIQLHASLEPFQLDCIVFIRNIFISKKKLVLLTVLCLAFIINSSTQ